MGITMKLAETPQRLEVRAWYEGTVDGKRVSLLVVGEERVPGSFSLISGTLFTPPEDLPSFHYCELRGNVIKLTPRRN